MEFKYKWHQFVGKIKRTVYAIQVYFNPRQKWLFKKIGNEWNDKDYIIETALFESMVHFWEAEDGEATIRYQFESIEAEDGSGAKEERDVERYLTYKKVYRELSECYLWAKVRDQAWENLYSNPKIGREAVEERARQEELLTANDTEVLQTIVRFRKYMWT